MNRKSCRKTRINKFLCLAIALILCNGCVGLQIRHFVATAERPLKYRLFFKHLDKVITEADVGDASSFALGRFPYLRANRFFLGLKEKIKNEAQTHLLIKQMWDLSLVTRKKEINNLPESAVIKLASTLKTEASKKAIIEQLHLYSEEIFQHDKVQKGFYDSAIKALIDPSEYSMFMRTFGVYPLFSLPVTIATNKTYNIIRKLHEKSFDELDVLGNIEIYSPPESKNFSGDAISNIFTPARKDALGVLRLTESEIKELIIAFAPVIYQDVVANYDKFGEVVWRNNVVSINTAKPVVYYYNTYSFIKNEPVLQLNYTIWYTDRKGPDVPWLERGPLDGLTIRITLNQQGEVVMADIVNNCGCFHYFAPNKQYVVELKKKRAAFDPLVPTWLPESFPQEYLKLFASSGWHQFQNISTTKRPSNATTYKLIAYDILEELPHPDGKTESVFDSNGIMKNSYRVEPFALFSMGTKSVGHMRQRGNHPVKLLGRAHFTDPDLFDKNFSYK